MCFCMLVVVLTSMIAHATTFVDVTHEAGIRFQHQMELAPVYFQKIWGLVRISGENSIDFLGRGISIDLHPSQFSFGQCAQTVMAHSNVMILNHTRDNPLLDIVVRRSFADHLWRWLLDVGKESEFRL